MSENKVKLGDGIIEELTIKTNQELSECGSILIDVVLSHVKEKIKNIDLNKIFGKKDKEKIISLWSSQLVEKGLLPKGYAGLPDSILIDNLHQEGYLDGLYAGYVISMMSLADNNASKELILSVRDDMRPNLIRHHFNNRDEFFARYKNEKYRWIEKASKDDQ